MKIAKALIWAIKILKSKGADSPALDAEALLAFTLGGEREFVLAHPEKKLTSREIARFKNLISRRARREPIAYLTGKKEFYGREVKVNRQVLIPRPETELLVEKALEKILPVLSDRPKQARFSKMPRKSLIVDVGTGSGCLAITIAKELEKQNARAPIFATDSSKKALALAKSNAKRQKISKRIKFLQGNLLEPLHFYRSIELENLIIVANLPYLTIGEWQKAEPEIKKYEPRNALVGGKDGLKYYRELLKQLYKIYKTKGADKSDKSDGSITPFHPPYLKGEIEGVTDRTDGTYKSYKTTCFFEINPKQKNKLTELVYKNFPDAKIEFIKDLSGAIRVGKISL
jgi:release factor glutamine methyltransferase